jgi:hypothetical protein
MIGRSENTGIQINKIVIYTQNNGGTAVMISKTFVIIPENNGVPQF